MPLERDRIIDLTRRIRRARTSVGPENAAGQWIASFFNVGITNILNQIMERFPDYNMRLPRGRRTWRLENIYGESRQIDHIISDREMNPVIIVETKWLKDQRHLKDKGSWILMMNDVQKAHNSIRGIVAFLAGEWNEPTIETLSNVAEVFHVIDANNLYDHLQDIGININIDRERNAFENPGELLTNILDVIEEALPDRDIIVETGLRMVKHIIPNVEPVLRNMLYPEEPEFSVEYELLIISNWGKYYTIKGTCKKIEPEKTIGNIRKLIEEN